MSNFNDIESVIDYYKNVIGELNFEGHPEELYDPINYILSIGGKRMRPVLVGLGNQLFNGNLKSTNAAAQAVEVFHNFTLVHDDIMDKAPLRRGKATVHEKWNGNIAILSGDVMLVKVYEILLNGNYPQFQELVRVINQAAIEVCEGQQLDMNFESELEVSLEDYLKMIELKTSVLLGAALKMGAMIANAPKSECDKLYDFGVSMGIAFQLMDDYLDAFGDPDKFGKQVGGDILANKKTFLSISALNLDKTGDAKLWFSKNSSDPKDKIESVLNIYRKLEVDKTCKDQMKKYHQKALKALNEIDVPDEDKNILFGFSEWLMNRNH